MTSAVCSPPPRPSSACSTRASSARGGRAEPGDGRNYSAARRSTPAAAGSAGEQGGEDLGVGGAPAGDRVPAGSGRVAGDRDAVTGYRVVAGGDVVEGLVVQRAAGDPVDG